ncbi:hypothetical protein LCGC14_1467380 [marine sediment metagenome]|uniref:Uncharacterized protein n=1 Tax=marine sediment metagenome TaxID=412755 RepID=A0A0F9JDZ8_9ZZZZ
MRVTEEITVERIFEVRCDKCTGRVVEFGYTQKKAIEIALCHAEWHNTNPTQESKL